MAKPTCKIVGNLSAICKAFNKSIALGLGVSKGNAIRIYLTG